MPDSQEEFYINLMPMKVFRYGQPCGTAFLTLVRKKQRKLYLNIQIKSKGEIIEKFKVIMPLFGVKKFIDIIEKQTGEINRTKKRSWMIRKNGINK